MKENRERYTIREMAGIFGVTSDAYYKWARDEVSRWKRQADAELVGLIREIVIHHEWRYGSTRVWETLRKDYGKRVAQKKVARLMRENGLNSRLPEKAEGKEPEEPMIDSGAGSKADGRDRALNKRLLEIRKAKGLTQEEFADRLTVSRSMIGAIEKGQRAVKDHIISLACLNFGANELWIRAGTGAMFDTLPNERLEQIMHKLKNLDENTQEFVLRHLDLFIEYQKKEALTQQLIDTE
jgi:transcriptional regulator with XRE-family HTH domain